MRFDTAAWLPWRLFPKFRAPGSIAARDLEACRETLDTLDARLPRISDEIGSRYLKSIGLLDPLTNASEALLRQSKELLEITALQSAGDSVVAETTALLQPSFAYLNDWRNQVQGRAAELADCANVFTEVQASEAILRELVSPLTQMQTMFRIESARLPEEVRQVFNGLTTQIANVHREVSETFGRQFEIVADALGTLRDVRSRIDKQASEIGDALAHHKLETDESVTRLNDEVARNAEREAEMGATSSRICQAVGTAVMALQLDDITRQRLDAVRSIVAQVRRMLTTPGADANEACCLLAIQKAQIDSVRKQLEDAETTLQTACGEIASKVHALNKFDEITAASNGAVDLSSRMTVNVRRQLGGVVECSRDFYKSMEPLGKLTHSLTGALERLSNRMRLIALNAQVQAVHIGSGTGLEVLAAQTAEVSADTSAVADKISTGISRVIDIVHELTLSFERILDCGEQMLHELEQQSSSHEERLRAVRNRTQEQLRLVEDAANEIRHCSLSLAEESSIRQTVFRSLDESVSLVTAAEQTLKRNIGEIDGSAAKRVDAGHYRMKAERDVHQAVLNDLAGVETSEEAAEPEQCEVELF